MKLYRLSRDLVSKGYGDLILIVKDTEYVTNKALFCGSNVLINNLVKDNQFNGKLTLFDECTMIGVIELEKYYSGGRVVINDSNCLDILSICLFYNEIILLKACEKYLVNHMNDSLLMKVIKNPLYLNFRYLIELKCITEEYLKFNSYKLFHYYILTQFSIDSIIYLLSNKNIYIGKENKLFELLYNYYESNFYQIINDNKEETEIINSIFSNINYNNIDLSLLTEKEKEFIDKYNLMNNEYQNQNLLICIDIKDNIPKEMVRIIVKYYQILNDYDYNSILSIDRKDGFVLDAIEEKDEFIISLLSNTNLIVVIVVLVIIIDINYDFNSSLYQTNVLEKMIEQYKLHSHLNNTIIKCFSLFIHDNKSFIERECGRMSLFYVLNHYEYLSEDEIYSVVEYLKKNIDISKEEEKMEEEYIKHNIKNTYILSLLNSIYYIF